MNNYGIRPGYQARLTPDYFHDVSTDYKIWQGEIYRAALHLARTRMVTAVVDLGCGQGSKLEPFMNEFRVVGVDYGDNLETCRQVYKKHLWIKQDLERPMPHLRPLATPRRLVICADVIEHLQDPTHLRDLLVQMADKAAAVVLSTPDRERVYGYDRLEAPTNVHHTREWTLAEMLAWLPSEAPIAWAGWARSNNVDHYKHTMMIVMSKIECVDGLLAGFEVERAV